MAESSKETFIKNEPKRNEIKFDCSKIEFLKIKNQLAGVLNYDEHSGEEGYTVRSLYFDSVSDRDLHSAISGLYSKRKIRLRTYDVSSDKFMLEYKTKEGTDGTKPSVSLNREQAEAMVLGDYSFLNLESELERELYMRLMNGGYRPKVVIEYNRIAFTNPISRMRITYDTNLRYSYSVNGFFDKEIILSPIMHSMEGVLEVKYDSFLPTVIKRILKSLDKTPSANSKYVISRSTM